jgi:leucyl aminopeptidase (aminopeptidase T)
MKKGGLSVGGGLLLAIGAVLLAQSSPPKMVDFEGLAQKLVTCAAVRPDELVLISGGPKNLELLEDLAVAVRQKGGNPMVTFGSDRLTRRLWTDVPEKYDTQSRDPWVKLAGLFQVQIAVNYTEDSGLLADIPPGRLVASGEADKVINDVLIKNNFRVINLGNGLYPTAQLARRFGLSMEELSGLFWNAVDVDYAELQGICAAVKSKLANGKEVRITSPNGTDFRVRIEARPVLVSDGVISEEDLKAGYAACQIFLPAGEVYLAPVPGTAEGRIVCNRDYFDGQEVRGLTMDFKAGKLVSWSAPGGLDRAKAIYDAAGAGKDEFGVIDIGVNPKVAEGVGGKVLNYVRAGMVSIGLGNNIWAGGKNDSVYGLQIYLTEQTLAVDGKLLVDKGKLVR